jgi:uncharacterized DUF497 family protein
MEIIDLPEPLEFEWDAANQTKVRLRHSIDPQEAEQPFFHFYLSNFDEKHSTKEKRYQILGATNLGRILFIVFTIRSKKIRIISARSANVKERSQYAKESKENS